MRNPQPRLLLPLAVLGLGTLVSGALSAGPVAPRAQAVIQIWMWGGPSHLDTFDPKPEAGSDYAGPVAPPIPTRTEGLQISPLLPLLAQQSDLYSVIRSMTHGSNAHETASYMMQTGREPGSGLVYPSVGATLAYLRQGSRPQAGGLPPYVVMTEALGRFAEEGFLGLGYKPFVTGGDPAKTPFAVEGIVSEELSDQRQADRRALKARLDTLGTSLAGLPDFEAADRYEDEAYALILGDARKAWNLGEESEATRDRYGRNTFGQSCLEARRLVERGVSWVTLNVKGWDTHKKHFEAMRQALPQLDQGLSALLSDLKDRGLLDSTIVWWGGEFGRTPKVSWEAPWNGGRSHFGAAFSVLVAGGGFAGGRVVGATDPRGETVVSRPVYPPDLIGAIDELLGIGPDAQLPTGTGTWVKAVPPPWDKPGAGRLAELLDAGALR